MATSRTALTALLLALAACAADDGAALTLSSIAPDLVCNGASRSTLDGRTTVTLRGAGFASPTPAAASGARRRSLRVTLAPVAALPGRERPARSIVLVDDPERPDAVRAAGDRELSFAVDPADALAVGVYEVTVAWPEDGVVSAGRRLAVLPPPTITALDAGDAGDASAELTITGADFLVHDGGQPTVTIGARRYRARADLAGCVLLAGFAERGVALCTTVTVGVARADVIGAAPPSVVVTNPAPADCDSSPTR